MQTINGGKENEYSKDFMKIKFDSDDDFSLNKLLKLDMLTIVFRSTLGKYYLQMCLDGSLYEFTELKILQELISIN